MMKVIRKSVKEREKESNQGKIVTVSKTNYFYWVCDECNVAFFDNDLILECVDAGYRCQNLRQKYIFSKKSTCGNSIYGGNEDSFNRYYKIAQ